MLEACFRHSMMNYKDTGGKHAHGNPLRLWSFTSRDNCRSLLLPWLSSGLAQLDFVSHSGRSGAHSFIVLQGHCFPPCPHVQDRTAQLDPLIYRNWTQKWKLAQLHGSCGSSLSMQHRASALIPFIWVLSWNRGQVDSMILSRDWTKGLLLRTVHFIVAPACASWYQSIHLL